VKLLQQCAYGGQAESSDCCRTLARTHARLCTRRFEIECSS